MYFQQGKNNIMTKNISERNHIESDVNHQISNEAKKKRKEDYQQKVVNNTESLTITADHSFTTLCSGNAVPHSEAKVLQTNGQG